MKKKTFGKICHDHTHSPIPLLATLQSVFAGAHVVATRMCALHALTQNRLYSRLGLGPGCSHIYVCYACTDAKKDEK